MITSTWAQTQPSILSKVASTLGMAGGWRSTGRQDDQSSRLPTSALSEPAALQEDIPCDGTSLARTTVVGLELLEAAATAADRRAFLSIWRAIDWNVQTPAAIAIAVRLAIRVDAPLLARELAARGQAAHPSSDELKRMARVLAPPAISAQQASPRPDIRTDRDWLRLHRHEYHGQWVALRGGVLLASAPTAEALLNEVGDVRGTGILVTPVW